MNHYTVDTIEDEKPAWPLFPHKGPFLVCDWFEHFLGQKELFCMYS